MPSSSDTSVTFSRLLRIFMLVAARRPHQKIRRRDLAAACECSVRCIGRDMARLRDAGIPIDWSDSDRTYILPDTGWSLPILKLDISDVIALGIARGLLTAPTVPYANAIRRAMEKVTIGIPPPLVPLLEAQSALIHTGGKARDYSGAPVAALLQAAFHRRCLEIDYESRRSQGRDWRTVDPYGIAERGDFLELHAWCHRRRQILTFALDRVYGARELGETFEVREDEWRRFREEADIVGALRGEGELEARVLFDPDTAPYARDHRWPATLTKTMQADGSLLLAGTAGGGDGLVKELLRWGSHAIVLGGVELRRRIADEVKALAAYYPETGLRDSGDPVD